MDRAMQRVRRPSLQWPRFPECCRQGKRGARGGRPSAGGADRRRAGPARDGV